MAAESPLDAVQRDCLRETSFAHTTRRAAEARYAGVAKWIGDHVKSKHHHTPPKGPKLCKELRHKRKALAGRYCQLLSGHAATGDYLCSKVHKLPSEKFWWCGQDVRQTRHYLFVNCAAWKPQIKELWKDVGYLCGWKNLRAPRMALLFGDERATKAVLSPLRKTNVGQMVTIPPRDEAGEEGGEGSREERVEVEGGEGGQGPPQDCLQGRGRRGAAPRTGRDVGGASSDVRCCGSPLSLPLCFPLVFSEGFGGKEIGAPRLDGRALHFGYGEMSFRDRIGEDAKGS